MLGLTQADLAKRAGLSTTGLNNSRRASTLEAIRSALEVAGAEFKDDLVGFRPFRVGDRVKYRPGKALDPLHWHAAGEIIEVESAPIMMGPVPRVRARIAGIESAWSMPSDFEFAPSEPDGSPTRVRV